MSNFNFGKYKGILVSVALFLILDASVLILNFYISFEISEDAVGVNLAGRQRMLSQRMAKSLFTLNATEISNDQITTANTELNLSKTLFDETLNAFYNGGAAKSASNEAINITAISNQAARQAMTDALKIWAPYKTSIEYYLDNPAGLTEAIQLADEHNLTLLKLMNDLTISLENIASSKATTLRIIQTVGISLALLNFFIIMFHFLRQLRESDAIVEQARKETTEILETVNEGLFLINEGFIIGEQHSAELKSLLGDENIAGKNLQDVLTKLVSEKDAITAKNFIDLLFSQKIKEKLIGDLNPLQTVEINVPTGSGAFSHKYLSFSFARAYNGDEISHVLVTVLDITAKIELEKALAKSQKESENQIEMLTGLLHTKPETLKLFIDGTHRFFDSVNSELKTSARNVTDLRTKAKKIFRLVHAFKGDSATLHLDYYENSSHLMEDTLEKILQIRELGGNDFLPFAVQLENLMTYTGQVEKLAAQLSELGKTVASPRTTTLENNIWGNIDELVQHLAKRNDKKITLVRSGLTDFSLQKDYAQEVKSICIQLLKNSVIHGVESASDRATNNKSEFSRIDLRLAQRDDNNIEISVEDDGRGINYFALKEKAINLGRWSEAEINTWPNSKLLSLIFKDGISTAEQVSQDAGRGVGMSYVAETINKHGGKINVSSKAGQHCKFTITLPLQPAA